MVVAPLRPFSESAWSFAIKSCDDHHTDEQRKPDNLVHQSYLRLRFRMRYAATSSPTLMKASIADGTSPDSTTFNSTYRPAPMRCSSLRMRSLSRRIASNSARMAFIACSSASTACISAFLPVMLTR